MNVSPCAGKPVEAWMVVNVPRLVTAICAGTADSDAAVGETVVSSQMMNRVTADPAEKS